jgi:prepilin-type N-terminal cleavage/methylation domain-containing protein
MVDISAVNIPPNNQGTRRGRRRGFTLIELLVVVTIIGILALIALPRFARTREKAYRSQMQIDLRTLVTAQEAYFDETAAYAPNVGNLVFNMTDMVTVQIVETAGNGWSAKATHSKTAIECGVYMGTVSAVVGVPNNGDGIITCSAA